MTEINDTEPLKIISVTKHSFNLEINSTDFKDYVRQGVVENVKVPKKFPMHDWRTSYKNPVASS